MNADTDQQPALDADLAEVRVADDGVVEVRFGQGSRLDIEAGHRFVAMVRRLYDEHGPLRILLDVSELLYVSREARYHVLPAMLPCVTAAAVFSPSLVGQRLAQLIFTADGLAGSRVRFSAFGTTEDARTWLRCQVQTAPDSVPRTTDQPPSEDGERGDHHARHQAIVRTLLAYSKRRFDRRVELLDRRDPLDDIAAAVNIVGDEFEELVQTLQVKNSELESVLRTLPVIPFVASIGSLSATYLGSNFLDVCGIHPELVYQDAEFFLGRVHPDDRHAMMSALDVCVAQGRAHVEYRFLHGSGDYRWFANEMRIVRSADGRPVYLSGVISDITDRREMQERLSEAEATALQSAKLAALGEMSSSIAHELNNPLFVTQGFARRLDKLLRESHPEAHDAARQHLEQILTSCDRMAAIVRHMREFSSHSDRHEGSCFVEDAIRDACDMMRAQLEESSIALDVHVPDSPLCVGAPKILVEQVLVNILLNARDAIREGSAGSGAIVVRVARAETRATIEVEDTGKGISEAARPRIFQPFFTTKDPGKGTGLGLATSRKLLLDVGATIRFQSVPDVGTRFVVEIPICDPACCEDPPVGAVAAPDA